MAIRDIEELSLYLIRKGLGLSSEGISFDQSTFESVDWNSLLSFANRQGVSSVVLDGIEAIGMTNIIPTSVKLRWIAAVDASEQKYERQKGVIAKLSGLYREHKIDMMVLKGYGISLLYPEPSHRPCGDVDIWLFGKQKEADMIMSDSWGTKVDWEHHHHTVFHVDGIMVENHYNFVNIYSHLSSKIVERKLQELSAKENCRFIDVDGEKVFLPSAQFNALFILRHNASHFAASKIGLRHIIDWGLLLKYYAADLDWKALEEFAKELNMNKFLYCINTICIEVLGIEPKVAVPIGDIDESLWRRVLNDVFHPEFDKDAPKNGGLIKSVHYKYIRWRANEWKHHLVYRESMMTTFIVQVVSHLMKPNSLK